MSDTVESLPVDRIDPSPYQPRVRFDEDRLRELASSIREHGVIQPIVVRPTGVRYQVIAGERRLRAVKLLSWSLVPAIIREIADEIALEAALVENLQREELSVVETAHAFDRLARQFHLSHAEIARRTGKSRSAVANTLRLLQLSEGCLARLERDELSEGHGRALLALPSHALQDEMAGWVVRNGLSVREAEARIRDYLLRMETVRRRSEPASESPARAVADPHLRRAEELLRRRFNTRVGIHTRSGKGEIVMEFYGSEDLDRLLEMLGAGA